MLFKLSGSLLEWDEPEEVEVRVRIVPDPRLCSEAPRLWDDPPLRLDLLFERGDSCLVLLVFFLFFSSFRRPWTSSMRLMLEKVILLSVFVDAVVVKLCARRTILC